MSSRLVLVVSTLVPVFALALAKNLDRSDQTGCCAVDVDGSSDFTSFLQTNHNVSTMAVVGAQLSAPGSYFSLDFDTPTPEEVETAQLLAFVSSDADADAVVEASGRARRSRIRSDRSSQSTRVAEVCLRAAGASGRLTISLARVLQRYKTASALGFFVGIIVITVLAVGLCLIPFTFESSDGSAGKQGTRSQATNSKDPEERSILDDYELQGAYYPPMNEKNINLNTAANDSDNTRNSLPAGPPKKTAASRESLTPMQTPSSVTSLPRYTPMNLASAMKTPSTHDGALPVRSATATSVPQQTPRPQTAEGLPGLPSARDASVFSSSAVSVSSGIPAICQTLVMPKAEMTCVVNLRDVTRLYDVPMDVRGSSGKPFLQCRLVATTGSRRMEVYAAQSQRNQSPVVSISQKTPHATLDVRGLQDQPYGTLVSVSDSQAKLMMGSTEAMVFEVQDATHGELVAIQNGVPVGRSTRRHGSDASVLKVTVVAGGDWPLVVAVFTSMLSLDFPRGSGLSVMLEQL